MCLAEEVEERLIHKMLSSKYKAGSAMALPFLLRRENACSFARRDGYNQAGKNCRYDLPSRQDGMVGQGKSISRNRLG